MSVEKIDEQLTKIKVWITFLNNVVDKGYNNNQIMLDTLVEYLDKYNYEMTTSDNEEMNLSDNETDSDSQFVSYHNMQMDLNTDTENENVLERHLSSKLKDLTIMPCSPPVEYVHKPTVKLVPNTVKELEKIEKFINNSFADNITSFRHYSINGTKSIDRMNRFIKSTYFIY